MRTLTTRLVASRSRSSWVAVVALTVCVLAVAAIVCVRLLDLPRESRWEVSKSAFEERVATGDVGDYSGGPLEMGSYKIHTAMEYPTGEMLFYEEPVFLDDAGVAYAPNGLENLRAALETPEFGHLGGPWYSFTHSW